MSSTVFLTELDIQDSLTGKLSYRTIAHPYWSSPSVSDESEEEEEEAADPAAHLAKQAAFKAEAQTYRNKPRSLHPEWPFIAPAATPVAAERLNLEFANRDQDAFCLHVYNDFTGYRIQECLENWIVGTGYQL